MNSKWYNTTEIFDSYERRFAAARANKQLTHPWLETDRIKILDDLKSMLSYRDDLVPGIHDMQAVSSKTYGTYDTIAYRYRTWPHFYGSATLFMPHTDKQVPLVFICCGHGKQGRLTECYMAMGHRLANLGIAALSLDNIGQGDRNPTPETDRGPDHWYILSPFYSGLTLQGLIVMETLAMIRYIAKDPRFDSSRFGACGNSGGGTLTMCLAALAPELSVLASSGYPSEISYILAKERRHCACNLLPGCAHGPEMWEIYSLFAPKPLLLEGGLSDLLIPMDLAHRSARKVRNTYEQFNASSQFEFTLTKTGHSWEIADLNRISRFLSERLLGVTPKDDTEWFTEDQVDGHHVAMPKDMLNTDALVQALTGVTTPDDTQLCDIFIPVANGRPVDPNFIQSDVGRGDVMRVFAQMECALKQHMR